MLLSLVQVSAINIPDLCLARRGDRCSEWLAAPGLSGSVGSHGSDNNAGVLYFSVQSGVQHTCAIAAADGGVACWGEEKDGLRQV